MAETLAAPRPAPAAVGAFWLSVALFATVWLMVLLAGPDELPGHFGSDGQVTRIDSAVVFLAGMGLAGLLLITLFASMPLIVGRIPIQFVNVPYRELWADPALRPELVRRMSTDMLVIGAPTVLLMTAILAISAYAGLGGEVPVWVFAALTGGYLLFVLGYLGWMLASGRYVPPRDPAEL